MFGNVAKMLLLSQFLELASHLVGSNHKRAQYFFVPICIGVWGEGVKLQILGEKASSLFNYYNGMT